MDQELEILRWDNDRRFGVEAEINAFDGESRPPDRNTLPAGITNVGQLVVDRLGRAVDITKWQATHNNNRYVVKPDSSCGMEVCTPVLKGWDGLEQVCRMTQAFSEDDRIEADERCSLHVHVNVADCSRQDVGRVIAWWLKCEPVFLDAMPARRKRSRYCQVVGMSDMFDLNSTLDPKVVIKKMGESKYFSVNDYHYAVDDPDRRRDTVEFRIAENDACTDPFYAKNWIRLVVHFVEMAKRSPWPGRYVAGNPKTGLAWLDPIDVFTLLGFMPGQYNLSHGLRQTRDWFLSRIHKNIYDGHDLGGIWGKIGRSFAFAEVLHIIQEIGAREGAIDLNRALHPPDMNEALYGDKYRT